MTPDFGSGGLLEDCLTTNGHELEAAVEVFRDVEALLGLAQELANRKASTSDFQPSDGLSTQENAIVLIERLYGHDIAVAVQLACDCFHHTDDASLLPPAQLTLCLDVLWMLAVAAGAGTGPVEEVQTGGTFSGSVDSSTSTLIGQRSKRSSVSSVLPEVEQSYTRTPALDRWLARQDERLLAWCQDVTGSPDLFNYKARLEKSPLQNLGLAFHLITKEFAVPRLLETEDLCSLDAIDARSVAIYLTELRSAVENDRKRRNRPSFEICTAAMENLLQVGPNLELDPGVTVTVTTTSSRSSSPTASELTFCSEDASEPENINQLEDSQLTLADFQHSVERNLAWMLSMEERLGNNFQDLQPFFGDKKGEENIVFEDKTAIQEARDITALENSQILDVSSLAEGFLTRLEAARKQFNTHEDLTAHLAKHQATVSRCLRYGHRLVNLVERVQRMSATSRSSTSVDEFNNERSPMEHLRSVQSSEVLLMASVLHARWTNLSKATEMGNQFLANCLLKRQEALLRAVEIQLGKLEWEKDRQETERFGCSIQELKSQLSANRRLETCIEASEGLAQRMQDIVILVPSETPDARDADLEDRIAALATRWSRLVEWVHTHYAQLQNALLHWRHFEEEAEVLADWLGQIEKEVHTIELSKAQEIQEKTEKREATAEVATAPLCEVNLADLAVSEAVVACISRYETRWAQLLASLDRRARTVREACGDSIEVQRAVESRVDALVSHWTQLTEPLPDWEEDSNCNAFRTITPSAVMEAEHSEVNLRQRTAKDEGKRIAEGTASGHPEKRISLDSGRVALIPTGYRAEFERRAEKLLNWLDSRAEALELVTMQKSDQGAQIEGNTSQSNNQAPESLNEVLERVGNELSDAKENMALVYSLGERYRKDLSQAGENVDELDQLFDDIDERWALLDQLFKKATLESNAQNAGLQKVASPETKSHSSAHSTPQNICESVETFRKWLQNAKDEATCSIKCEDGNQLDNVIANFTRTVQLQPRTSIIEQFLATLTTPDMKELTEKWQQLRQLINERITVLHNLCENHDMFIPPCGVDDATRVAKLCTRSVVRLKCMQGPHLPPPVTTWCTNKPCTLVKSRHVAFSIKSCGAQPPLLLNFVTYP
ncbi:unnamed protein product [Mesocestoides corti]|uniref:Calponin-homology (CH) domain-containing protein n=1 Tax=Mesocestoides corti TaxID=53468 RepID=A0A158QW59_MESCO|nr:unnamed protein product [Mesocestoides corti]